MFRFAQHDRVVCELSRSAAQQFALTGILIFENRSALDRGGKCRQNFLQFCSYLSQLPRSPKTSKRLTAKNTKTPRSRVSNPMASSSKRNSGITKVYFTELPKEVQEHFHYDSGKGRLVFCRAGRQLHRISKATGGNATSTTGRRRKEQCGSSGTTSRHKSHAGLANPLRRASETGR